MSQPYLLHKGFYRLFAQLEESLIRFAFSWLAGLEISNKFQHMLDFTDTEEIDQISPDFVQSGSLFGWSISTHWGCSGGYVPGH
jgi:hypothetical protein